MLKIFPIEFISKTLSQTLLEEHITDVNLYGGKDQVNITSFYEQLKSQEEVDRFVETYRDLTEQQNRTGLIMNGVVVSPENPTITNLYSCLIVPMTWTCSFRVNIANRDNAIVTLNNLTNKLKGKKVDIAQLDLGNDENGIRTFVPFKVGTIGQNEGAPAIKNGDYIGDTSETDLTTGVTALMTSLVSKGIPTLSLNSTKQVYVGHENKIKPIKVTYKQTQTPSQVSFEVTDSDGIIDIHFDSMGESEILVNGTVKYGTTDLTEIPETINFKVNFEVSDNNHYEYIQQGITAQKTDMYIDDGVLWFSASFSFTIATSEWDLETINVIDDDETDCVATYEPIISYYYEVEVITSDEESDIPLPPEHNSFEKYKLSMSFDAIRCDEPNNLNSQEYCELTISGSATLVNNSVQLGNDLLKVGITKIGINAQTPITFSNPTTYWVEPMEMPSGSNANTQINQLVSNNFMTNTHTDAIALSLQYSFICDKSNDLLKQLFKYARYGTRGVTKNDISPNMIFSVKEIWSSWGEYEENEVKAKIVENIDIENTESDTLTIGLTMQIQGDND